jgi:uncharacterized membrane protein YjgN (DUF898 family)
MAKQSRFTFDGGAGTYLGTALLGFLITICTLGITICTLGICYPFALVLNERWRAKHTFIDGQQLVFTGSATGLFGHWVKWFLLSVITIGIYLFWVGPKVQQWITVNTDFAKPVAPLQSWAAGQQGSRFRSPSELWFAHAPSPSWGRGVFAWCAA